MFCVIAWLPIVSLAKIELFFRWPCYEASQIFGSIWQPVPILSDFEIILYSMLYTFTERMHSLYESQSSNSWQEAHVEQKSNLFINMVGEFIVHSKNKSSAMTDIRFLDWEGWGFTGVIYASGDSSKHFDTYASCKVVLGDCGRSLQRLARTRFRC